MYNLLGGYPINVLIAYGLKKYVNDFENLYLDY